MLAAPPRNVQAGRQDRTFAAVQPARLAWEGRARLVGLVEVGADVAAKEVAGAPGAEAPAVDVLWVRPAQRTLSSARHPQPRHASGRTRMHSHALGCCARLVAACLLLWPARWGRMQAAAPPGTGGTAQPGLAGAPEQVAHGPVVGHLLLAVDHPDLRAQPRAPQGLSLCSPGRGPSMLRAQGPAWSRVAIVGDRPPCTQKMRPSMSAARLRAPVSAARSQRHSPAPQDQARPPT